jgi:hypothetical protein
VRLGVQVEQDVDRFFDRALGFHRGLGPAPDLRPGRPAAFGLSFDSMFRISERYPYIWNRFYRADLRSQILGRRNQPSTRARTPV